MERYFMKNLSKIELLLLIIIVVGLYFVISPMVMKKVNHTKRVAEIKKGQEKLTNNCDLTSIDSRIECFKSQIEEGRKRNKNTKVNYKMVYKKDQKTVVQNLKGTDQGDVVTFERPENLVLVSCVSNTIIFDWDNAQFYISPEASNSGAICETNSHGRVAFVPQDLTAEDISLFYQILRKTIE